MEAGIFMILAAALYSSVTRNVFAGESSGDTYSFLESRAAAQCPPRYPHTSSMCLQDSRNLVPEKSGVSEEDKTTIIQVHNKLRAGVEPPASDMAALTWDDKLAEVAQKWANQCKMMHDATKAREIPDYGLQIGQNLAGGHSTWPGAIKAWYDELTKYGYRYGTDVSTYINWHKIGHYTQVVNSGVFRVGCGFASCRNSQYSRIYACNYASGQTGISLSRPYESGKRCGKCPKNCKNGLCDCHGKLCRNGGKLILNECRCDCVGLYSGENCAVVKCPPADKVHCGTAWPKGFCKKYANVPEDCPYMCGVCKYSFNSDSQAKSSAGQVDAAPDISICH